MIWPCICLMLLMAAAVDDWEAGADKWVHWEGPMWDTAFHDIIPKVCVWNGVSPMSILLHISLLQIQWHLKGKVGSRYVYFTHQGRQFSFFHCCGALKKSMGEKWYANIHLKHNLSLIPLTNPRQSSVCVSECLQTQRAHWHLDIIYTGGVRNLLFVARLLV